MIPVTSPPSVTRIEPTFASTIFTSASYTVADDSILRTSLLFPRRISETCAIGLTLLRRRAPFGALRVHHVLSSELLAARAEREAQLQARLAGQLHERRRPIRDLAANRHAVADFHVGHLRRQARGNRAREPCDGDRRRRN